MIKKYGVIGDPIEHSLSPIIHKEFSNHFGIQLQYEKYLVKDNQLSDFINQSKSSLWTGLNLTIPHKIKAIDCDAIANRYDDKRISHDAREANEYICGTSAWIQRGYLIWARLKAEFKKMP